MSALEDINYRPVDKQTVLRMFFMFLKDWKQNKTKCVMEVHVRPPAKPKIAVLVWILAMVGKTGCHSGQFQHRGPDGSYSSTARVSPDQTAPTVEHLSVTLRDA